MTLRFTNEEDRDRLKAIGNERSDIGRRARDKHRNLVLNDLIRGAPPEIASRLDALAGRGR